MDVTVESILGQADLLEKFVNFQAILIDDDLATADLKSLEGSCTEDELRAYLRKFFSSTDGKNFIYIVDEVMHAELLSLPDVQLAYLRTAFPESSDDEIIYRKRLVEALCPPKDIARVWAERQTQKSAS